ncbi:hypothetical protein COOONC_27734 [Cooperia oncophora]
MRSEEACLLFCSDTRSRCRSIVYDSVQHICHFFLDYGNDFTIPAAKMIYLKVTSTECLDPSSSEANNVDQSSREASVAAPRPAAVAVPQPNAIAPPQPASIVARHPAVVAPPQPMIPPGQFIIPPTPTASFEPVTEAAIVETTLVTTTDMFADFTTPESLFEEGIPFAVPVLDNAEEDLEMEKLGRKNELMRDINGLENHDKSHAAHPPPVRAVKLLPARVLPARVEPIEVPIKVEPVQVEAFVEKSTMRAPTTTQSNNYVEGSVQKKLEQLKRKYPSRYAQYLIDKEEGFAMHSPSTLPTMSSTSTTTTTTTTPSLIEDVFTAIPVVENNLFIEDAEVLAPAIPVRPKINRRTMFPGKRIAFSDDHMFSRKIDGADIRRHQQKRLKQVTLGAPTPTPTAPSYVNKARNFLEMVNVKESSSDAVKNSVGGSTNGQFSDGEQWRFPW